MPTYFVRTNDSRVISVKADRFRLRQGGNNVYEFVKDGETVASFNCHSVMAVILSDVFEGEDTAIEETTDDVCIDCRNQELLDSDEFLEAVFDIVTAWHEPDDDTPEGDEPSPDAPASGFPIEHWKDERGEVWGFQTPEGFIHFSKRSYAANGREAYLGGNTDSWNYLDLTGYTKVED